MDAFVSWAFLLSYPGATAGVKVLVDIVKYFFPIEGKQVLGVAMAIGVGLIFAGHVATATFVPKDTIPFMFNGLIVGLAASGFNDLVKRNK